ncbi:hypothetical protein M3O96_00180 [Aquiflexum sp. TKW24L]|uniref:hypothetical protein n=1 Tax=Aquiflexum sp. TKW24L TaxID=2942212 RepID=UPI0020C15EE8|nr:hypothetical protein [Aquiflexum sp. TKW24L]MCL6257486.1 hypothetical protein [Aquiflexum sp. TKW24L]
MKSILKINVVLILVFSFSLFSCTSYKNVVESSGPDKTSGIPLETLQPGDKVKITKKDGSKVYLVFERVEDSQIFGEIHRDSAASGSFKHYDSSIPLEEIQQIELKKFSLGKTLGIPLGAAALAFVLYIMAFGGAFS